MFYVYTHSQADTGEVFYVGKGSGGRSHEFRSRSEIWKRFHKKHGTVVSIVKSGMSEACAFTLEIIQISKYRSMGQARANLSSGGSGPSGHKSTRRKAINCSNGIRFESTRAAADWLRGMGYPKASHMHLSNAASRSGSAYGFAWWRDGGNPSTFTSKSEKSIESSTGITTYCSNGMIFASRKAAVRWLRENGHPKAVAPNIATCCKGENVSAYGFSWSHVGRPEHPNLSPSQLTAKAISKPIGTTCGMSFESQTSAAKWLKENGFPKAKQGNISTSALSDGRTAYGYKWVFLQKSC